VKRGLNDDKVRHTGEKLYSCSQCEKRFTTQQYLKIHMNVHSSKYKCTESGKCFSSNHKLTVHRRSHSGEKPFECTVCSKQFTYSSNLVAHSRIHSGEKPYKCLECDNTNVLSVTRHLVSLDIYKLTRESTRETNHTSVHCVTKVSLYPATCTDINVMYTATEDLMTVVTVGSCLKVVVN